ncbi:MAG: radical SAM protein [candidate division WOR-3 bacterium]
MSGSPLFARKFKINLGQYKFSYYNIVKNMEDGGWLLFNTKTGAFSVIPSKVKKLDNKDMVNNFLANGYIVNKDKDELDEVIMSFRKIREDKTIMRLIILPAEMCNFRCIYCYETFRRIKIFDEVILGIINFIKRNIATLSILEISWFGGEPLLAISRIIEITKRCQKMAKAYGIRFLSDVTTNGYLLTPKLIKSLIDVGVIGYQVTIDGPPLIHNRLRKLKNGRGTFEKIWSNLREFKKFDKEFYVVIRTNFDKNSYVYLNEWIDLYQNEFGKDSRFRLLFRPIFKTGTERDKQMRFCSFRESAEIESEILIKLWEKLEFPRWYFDEVILSKPKAIYCYGGLPGCFVIGADGALWKCTVGLKEEDALGHIKENGEILIDENKLNEWNKYSESWIFDDTCRKCLWLPLCMGGCILSRKYGKKGCYTRFSPLTKVMELYYKNIIVKKGGD